MLSSNAFAFINWGNSDVNDVIKKKVESVIDERCDLSNTYLSIQSFEYNELWYDRASYEFVIAGSDFGGSPDYEVKVVLTSNFADEEDTFYVSMFEDIEGTCEK